MHDEAPLEIHAASQQARGWLVASYVVGIPLLVLGFVTGGGRLHLVAAVLLLVQAATNHQRTIVDGNGITLDVRWRTRHVPWTSVGAIRLRWGGDRGPLLTIERRGAEEVRVDGFLGNLARYPRRAERVQLIDRLRREADRYGFELDVHQPTQQRG